MKDIEDEIPFDLPDGWAWCRLGEICEISSSKRVLQKDWKKSGIPFYRAREITQLSNNEKVKEDLFITPELYKEIKQKYGVPEVGDLLVSAVGTIGKIYIVNESDCFYYKDASVICFSKKFKSINSTYLKLCCESNFIQKQMYSLSKGTTVDTITINKAQKYLFPLPPLAEQKRIVAKIETIFVQIDLLEQNKADLQKAVKQVKSKILDLAMHGKLVPQDTADEPASVMLEKLRVEKEVKIAAGEIKRGKNDSYIYKSGTDNCYYQKYTDGCEENISDEIPFDVPDGWAWCRLPNLCKIPITDGTHQTPTYSDKEHGIPFLSSKDVTSRKIDWSKIKYITKELHEELQKRVQPCRNDILLAKNGTTGVAALVDTDKIFDIYVTLALLRPAEVIHPNYLHYVINSPFCKKQFNSHLTGIGVPNLHLNDICKTIIPLPSLFEQQRIVTKIEELFAQLDFITTAL
ncbi:restriction endonuclease subunit S [Treponema socranskii]|uniref:restriction endonuclease subunit S n=3 Tax=Treponema socranskii TaxID=53419 RepID=UPI003D9432B3